MIILKIINLNIKNHIKNYYNYYILYIRINQKSLKMTI